MTSDNPTVMIVDDEPSNLALLTQLLRPHYRVRAVTSGQRCLEAVQPPSTPDLILLDIMMPEMDGWQTVKEIVDRGYLPGNIISMFTARDISDQKMESLAKYVTDYIQKPFDPGELVLTVTEYSRYLG